MKDNSQQEEQQQQNRYVTIKVYRETRKDLKFMAAFLGQSIVSMIDDLLVALARENGVVLPSRRSDEVKPPE